MEIRSVGTSIPPQYAYKQEADKAKSDEVKAVNKDEFVKSDEAVRKVTYDKPKVDLGTIAKLKLESERAYNHLKEIVVQLLQRQGLTFNELEVVEVDEQASMEASALISEGGALSPEKVSDRIVGFAKAISGGDKEKIELLRGAIEKGFAEAARILGGELPEICQQTYQLVMEKLDRWMEE